MKIEFNPLMRKYFFSYDLDDVIEDVSNINFAYLESQLPNELQQLIQSPILQDSFGRYFIGTEENISLVERFNSNKFNENYASKKTLSLFEYQQNKVDMKDYDDRQEYDNNLGLQAENQLRYGLFFSLLLADKLSKILEQRFKVIFAFGIARYVDCNIWFHAIREGEEVIGDIQKSLLQGVLVLQ